MPVRKRVKRKTLKGYMVLEPNNVLVPTSFSIKKEFATLNYCNWLKGDVDIHSLVVVPVTITRGKNE